MSWQVNLCESHWVTLLDGLAGSIAPLVCVDKTAYMRCRKCIGENRGVVRIVMRELRDAIDRIVEFTSPVDMSDQIVRSANAESRFKVRTQENLHF